VAGHESAIDATRAQEARFRALVAARRDAAVALAWRLTGGDAAAAEDVAQEAFLRAWRALPGFRDEAQMSTWLHRIIVRQAARHRRWRALRRLWMRPFDAAEARGEVPDRGPGPDAGLGAAGDVMARARIAAALDELPRGQREAFVLVHLQGLSVAETAAVMRCAPGTVKSHLHRALAKLRVRLAGLRGSEAT
jgi:RNA polymerase sigma-70 factor (ECF subfamily)